ncbi:MAG: hypothetical protein P8O91_04480 [Luminiphilus sp.]|nr:hypothetical protein [Luminiphilus sp.]
MSMLSILGVGLFIGWLLLMLSASVAEYRYYRAVALLEPEIWVQLGAPNHWVAPFMFLVTPDRKRLLDTVDNPHVLVFKQRFKVAARLFLAYVVAVLLSSIAFFKWA